MAAREMQVGHGIRKGVLSPSTPPKLDVSHRRRASISSWPGSPCGENPVLKEKPIPHYRLPTISSSKDVCKIGKRYESKLLTLNATAQRGSPKEKPHTRKLNSPKSLAYGKNQPVVKTNSPIKESSVKERREATPTVPGTSRTSTTCIEFDIVEKPTTALNMQEEEKPEQDLKAETVEEEVVKYGPLDIPPLQDKSLYDRRKVFEACDSTTLLEEQHEEGCTTEARGEIKAQDGEGGTHHQEEKEVKQYDEECSDPFQYVERVQGEKGPEEDFRTNGRSAYYQLKFRQGKVMENKEAIDGTRFVQLKFKEREGVDGVVEVLIAELMKVVLRRQGVQGKKEAAAYNDVIEETLSKLVEKRKSKVKALVGAFETVISLQE